jgi:hypothetical protein
MEESVQVKGPKWLEGVNNLIKNLQITRVKWLVQQMAIASFALALPREASHLPNQF